MHMAAAIAGIIRYLITAAPLLSLSLTQNLAITDIFVSMNPIIAPKLTSDIALVRLSWKNIAVSPTTADSSMFLDGVLNLGCTYPKNFLGINPSRPMPRSILAVAPCPAIQQPILASVFIMMNMKFIHAIPICSLYSVIAVSGF